MTPDHVWRQLCDLLAVASEQVTLIAPFIKRDVFEDMIGQVPATVSKITCVTRWSAAEIAAGASDPEIIDVVKRDDRITLMLSPFLHAKIYIVDGRCLVGSANLTNRAVGRSVLSNVEVLVDTDSTHPEVTRAVAAAMHGASEATEQLARQLRAQADSIIRLYGDPDFLASKNQAGSESWIPETREPARLFPVYCGAPADYQSDVLDGVMRDLMFLDIPGGLSEIEFRKAVADRLRNIPVAKQFVLDGHMPSSLLESEIIEFTGCGELEARRRAVVIGEWFQYFDRASLLPLGQWELRQAIRRSGSG